jgi:PAS domain S-box-containing protein
MLIIFIIDLSIIISTNNNWNSSVKKYFPLKSVVETLRNDIVTAHLWLEESISGDKYINLDTDVWNKLEVKNYKKYIKDIKNTFSNDDDIIYYEKLVIIDENIDISYAIAKERVLDTSKHKIGSDLDQVFDKQFNKIDRLFFDLTSSIDNKLAEEFKDKNNYFTIVLSLFLIVNIIAFMLIFRFLKEKQKHEKRLHFEKERAFVTLNSIGDAVITTDKKGFITFLNPIAEDLTGYLNSEAEGKYLDDVFNIVNETTKLKIDSPVKKVLKEGTIVGLANHTALINKHNEIYSIEDSASPIRNIHNEIIGTVLVFHDVTKQQQVRNKLNENEKILIQQSKMAAMGEMLENIAHQWRQPLSVISTAATGIKLQKEVGILDDEFLLKSVNLINDSSQHLSSTIDDFRSFFKPNRKKEKFNIENSYKKVIQLLSPKLKNRNIKVIDKMLEIEIVSFENELVQGLMNIITNAIDALENIESKKYIFVEMYQCDKKVGMKIYDTAGGILEDIIIRIFEPYFSTKHQSQGTGIGLYMTEEIISKHMDGKISVHNKKFEYENENYVGAEFIIELPLS